MFVCVCHALTDGDVRSAAAEGAATQTEVFRHFGLKAQCGRCKPCMGGMLGGADNAGERRHLSDGQPAERAPRRQER